MDARPPRVPLAPAKSLVAAVALALAVVLAGCGASSAGDDTTRNAAASSTGPLPTKVFAGTSNGGLLASGPKAGIVRCDLATGPCTQIASHDGGFTVDVQYAAGRVFFRNDDDAVMSCSSTVRDQCVTLLRGGQAVSGPVFDSEHMLFVTRRDNPTLYSCDPATARAIADCTARPFQSMSKLVAIGPGVVAGTIDEPRQAAGRTVAVCQVDDASCRTLATLPKMPIVIDYIPRFERLYLGFGTSKFGTDDDGYYPMWTCRLEGRDPCTVLNRLGAASMAFAGIGDTLYVALPRRIMACDPVTPDRCTTKSSDDLGIQALETYGDALVVGTGRSPDGEGTKREGGIYLRPLSGGQTTLRPNAGGGIWSLDTNQADAAATLATTVTRYTPRGSGVTATGTVTVSPQPLSGDAECVLGPPELPVACTSTFDRGATVTLTAKPGPQSALNTWQGAASQCNEPEGPGSPPALTCTITLKALRTVVTAGFRPA